MATPPPAIGPGPAKCKVHPIVVFNILDHFSRRTEQNSERVIGTLLGVSTEGTVEITNCFPVPYTENEQVAVDMEFHRNMFELHHKASPRETIVGWYATGAEITESSVLLQEFYWREINHSPVHITVDTSLTNYKMAVKGYVSSIVPGGEQQTSTTTQHFQPVQLEIKASESEKTGVDTLVRAATHGEVDLVSDLDNLETSITKLLEMLQTISEYVDKVIAGTITPDNKIGRFLTDTLSELPKIESDAFEKMLYNSIQDVLMVVYLANLTRTQLVIAEKLQGLF
jgi:translation initiation factor 3 subunit F